MPRTSDVVVVGGGVIGLAVACYLSREKVRVTLVERGAIGQEASWAAAGYLSFQGSSNLPGPRLELTRASARMYESWIQEIGELTPIDTGFWRSGLLEVCLNEPEVTEARARAGWQRAAGYAVEWLDASAVRQRQPALSEQLPVHGALLFPEVAQVRPPRLLKALAEASVRRGVHMLEHSPVAAITREGDRVTGVELATGGHLEAPVVVNAAGCWASQLAPEMAAMPVRPIKGTIVLLEVQEQPSRELVISSAGSLYPRADNKLLLGATVEDAGYDKRVKVAALHTLVEQGIALVPKLKNATVVTAWAGLRPFSHDNLPYLGPVPDLDGAFVAAGHYRSGILLAPITGLLLKEMILGERPTLPLEPYGMTRLRTATGSPLLR
ncbi:MAG TPA: glycine oxidase ThiO [Candidatus Bathyarchaeia archaeon]|nr:glycine oxidase ThiO [Candidatus Bathyarchaeia archaeon]